MKTIRSYKAWIKLRNNSKDEHGEKLCYCGHTYKCSCSDPDKTLFKESVKRGSVILFDKDNGWEKCLSCLAVMLLLTY